MYDNTDGVHASASLSLSPEHSSRPRTSVPLVPHEKPDPLKLGLLKKLRRGHITHEAIVPFELALIATYQRRKKLPQSGKLAGEILLIAHNRAIIKWAHRFKRPTAGHRLDFEEIVSVAQDGFLKALERFDFSKGVKLLTYASHWIRHFIDRAIANTGYEIRVPVWASEAGKKPIPDGTRISRSIARNVLFLHNPVPNGHVGDDGSQATFMDVVASTSPSPEEEFQDDTDRARAKALLMEALGKLTPNQQTVIRYRFLHKEDNTLQVIGDMLGLSRERIRQIEAEAMRRLRFLMGKHRAQALDAIGVTHNLPAQCDTRAPVSALQAGLPTPPPVVAPEPPPPPAAATPAPAPSAPKKRVETTPTKLRVAPVWKGLLEDREEEDDDLPLGYRLSACSSRRRDGRGPAPTRPVQPARRAAL